MSLSNFVTVSVFFCAAISCTEGSSLLDAIAAEDLERVRALVHQGADVNQKHRRLVGLPAGEPRLVTETPLLIAVRSGDVRVVDILLESGADPNVICTDGRTALLAAVSLDGRHEIISSLVSANARVVGMPFKGKSLLAWAASSSDYHSFNLLLEVASREGSVDAPEIRSLLRHRMDDLRSPIEKVLDFHLASGSGSTSRLEHTVRFGHNDELPRLLADPRIDPCQSDEHGWTALHWAAGYEGTVIGAEMLLVAGADPNSATDHGFTPLMAAAQASKIECVRLLISRGADPHAAAHFRWTALGAAARRASPTTVRELLKHATEEEIKRAAMFARYREDEAADEVQDMLAQHLEQMADKAGVPDD